MAPGHGKASPSEKGNAFLGGGAQQQQQQSFSTKENEMAPLTFNVQGTKYYYSSSPGQLSNWSWEVHSISELSFP